MEKESGIEGERSIIDRPEVQDFIKERDIRPEDFALIEKLASFPKDIIIANLHNFFNTYHERSGKELTTMIENSQDVLKELYETVNQFYQKYGWPASWNLVRLLEKI